MKISMEGLAKGQKGQALIAALIVLVVGSLLLTPLLGLMGTGTKSGQVFDRKVHETYAADAGVEDAMWHIRNNNPDDRDNPDKLLREVLGTGYNPYDYSANYPYLYNLDVNDKEVAVNVTNVWLPKDISVPSPSLARQIMDDEKLLIVGYPASNTSTYVIKIVYNWDTATNRDALQVKKIGIWISTGFEYVDGSCSLTGYSNQDISPYKGGSAVVWTFASPPGLRQGFPPTTDTSNPTVRTFTFKYTGPEGQIPELVSSWIETKDNVPGTNYSYSWDDSIRLYKIVSQAGTVEVESYGAKTKFRKLKSTISSDYAVAGNTLLTTLSGDWADYRDKLLAESSSTIQRIPLQSINSSGIVPVGKIPEEATIDKVCLYWSGWIDPYYWYKSGYLYYWAQIPALQYNQNTKAQLVANSQVNQVKFNVDSATQTITANISSVHSGNVPDIQIVNTPDAAYPSKNSESWDYSCFKDITNLVVSGNVTVQQYIENAMKAGGSGTVTFTLGHADEVIGQIRASPYQNYNFTLYNTGLKTGYPLATPAHQKPNEGWQTRYQWAYADWSLIIFYRSPALIQRQLYLYDDLVNVQYPGGTKTDKTFSIGGFLAPPVITDNDKSHITYFVGEGDYLKGGSKVGVNIGQPNGSWLGNPGSGHPNPVSDVLDSYSSGLPNLITDGEDVDTFVLPTGCINPYDTQATITLETSDETYTLVYLVLSFRSEITTGGVITNYQIKVN